MISYDVCTLIWGFQSTASIRRFALVSKRIMRFVGAYRCRVCLDTLFPHMSLALQLRMRLMSRNLKSQIPRILTLPVRQQYLFDRTLHHWRQFEDRDFRSRVDSFIQYMLTSSEEAPTPSESFPSLFAFGAVNLSSDHVYAWIPHVPTGIVCLRECSLTRLYLYTRIRHLEINYCYNVRPWLLYLPELRHLTVSNHTCEFDLNKIENGTWTYVLLRGLPSDPSYKAFREEAIKINHMHRRWRVAHVVRRWKNKVLS